MGSDLRGDSRHGVLELRHFPILARGEAAQRYFRDLTSLLRNNRQTDPAGTLDLRAGALERNLFNVRHDRPLPLLDLTLGGVRGCPYNLNKTRIPRRRKWSWRV